jgi:hypothetical protein
MSDREAERTSAATGQGATEPPASFRRAVLGLLKELYFSLFGIVFLVSLLVSIGLFSAAAISSGTVQTVWLGIATSLLASSVFASLYLLLTSEVDERLLRATVAHEMNEVATKVVAQSQERQRRYVPIVVYGECDDFDPSFNRDLNEDLSSTTRYVYYGLTGRYVGARLLGVTHRINDVLVIVGDPTSEAAIRTRMLHSYVGPDAMPDRDEIRDQLVADVDRCVIGLFRNRRSHENIELCVAPSPNFDRVEICDAAAYLTLFSTRDDQSKAYPETLKFSADAIFYAMMLRDAHRAAHAPEVKMLRLRAETTHRDLLRFYDEAFERRLSQADLASMEDRFRGLRGEFSHKLRQLELERDGTESDLGPTRRLVDGYRAARDRLRGR